MSSFRQFLNYDSSDLLAGISLAMFVSAILVAASAFGG
jgi:hypothetical protein